MILTHESGAQEDPFDEKKWRQKISWYYPFKFFVFLSLWDTMEEVFIRCGIQRKMLSSIVG
jgi:hypothetical protein